jgi:hypothetical protein
MQLQALLTKRAISSLDVGIFVWTMRRDHVVQLLEMVDNSTGFCKPNFG